MLNFEEIVSSNAATFYDYSKGEDFKTTSYQVLKFLFAVVFALIFSQLNTSFLSVILSIYAILIGFGFNILFYLLNFQKKVDDSSLEKEVLSEKINKLSSELFYNVAYFNLISVFLIILCLVFYLGKSLDGEVCQFIFEYYQLIPYSEKALTFLKAIKTIASFLALVCFYYLIIESLFTFMRITSRAFYMFKKLIEPVNKK